MYGILLKENLNQTAPQPEGKYEELHVWFVSLHYFPLVFPSRWAPSKLFSQNVIFHVPLLFSQPLFLVSFLTQLHFDRSQIKYMTNSVLLRPKNWRMMLALRLQEFFNIVQVNLVIANFDPRSAAFSLNLKKPHVVFWWAVGRISSAR